MTCGVRPLISPHAFKRPRSPMKSVFRTQLINCSDQSLLATHSRKRNCVVQVVCECGGSRPDCRLAVPTVERIALRASQTSWFRMFAEVRTVHQGCRVPPSCPPACCPKYCRAAMRLFLVVEQVAGRSRQRSSGATRRGGPLRQSRRWKSSVRSELRDPGHARHSAATLRAVPTAGQSNHRSAGDPELCGMARHVLEHLHN